MRVNIGITISLNNPKENSIFSNGIRQNIILLQEIFEKCNNVEKSYIINVNNVSKEDYKGTTWEKYSDFIITKEQANEKCDVIVVCHGSIAVEEYESYRKLGKKMVIQILGAEQNGFNERILFNLPASGIFRRNKHVDAVWVSPHFYNRDRFFFETMYDSKVYEAPYIWSPKFIDNHINLSSNKNDSLYKPGSSDKRISTMEPNINLVKTSTVPIVIAELLYRKYPELLKAMNVFGTSEVKKRKDLIDFVKDLDCYKDKKMFFESRYPIVWILNNKTDIVLCHQEGCELNYLYLDAAWLGYPIVHNSPMMKDLGWYYPEKNANIAIEHINYIAKNFDNLEYPNDQYLEKSRKFASKYTIDNLDNIEGYERLINTVIKKI